MRILFVVFLLCVNVVHFAIPFGTNLYPCERNNAGIIYCFGQRRHLFGFVFTV